MIKKIVILLLTVLSSCNNSISNSHSNEITSNSDEFNYSENYEIPFITEEEQYVKSDLVILVKANGIGNVEIINDKPYTIYYFSIIEFYKGDEEINFAYFYGNTTAESTISSSIDEKLIENEEYKLYLCKKNDRFFTTSGFQSIIKK